MRLVPGAPKAIETMWEPEWADENDWSTGEPPRLDGDGMPLNPAGRTDVRGERLVASSNRD